MDSTLLYGYVPTHWIAILFGLSYVFSICTMIPALFIHYRNIALGVFVVAGLLFQLTGHVSMTVSAFLPTAFPAWATQHFAFTAGKLATRIAVFYVYYSCFSRIPYAFVGISYPRIRNNDNCLVLIMVPVIAGVGFTCRFIAQGFEIASLLKDVERDANVDTLLQLAASSCLYTTILLYAFLLFVIIRSRKDIPWLRLTWMTGYYVTLQIIPIFLLTQDIFDLVRSIVPYHNEMVELLCDLGMTKSILLMLGGQSYEIAYSWSQKRLKALEKIELQVKEILEYRSAQPKRATERNGN